ncbi:MAG: hypothetical protein LVT47_06010 [Cyanobacteria bacterium LVE1205-1]|jgi:hypothetical protein
MKNLPLSVEFLFRYLRRVIEDLEDPRKPSNNHPYALMDVVLGTFSAFFMQNESFLGHQRQLHSRWGRNNAQTLFGVFKISSSAQIRNVLDGIPASGGTIVMIISNFFMPIVIPLKRQTIAAAWCDCQSPKY